MPRHTVRSMLVRVPLVASLAILPAACGQSAEERVVESFFRAARVGDNMTLGSIAAVSFNRSTDGIVERHRIVEVGPEERRTVDVQQLQEAHVRAKEEEAAFDRKRQEFQAANSDIIARVTQARASGEALRGRDAEVYTTLEQWRDEHNESQRRLSEVRTRLDRDRAQAVYSLTPPGTPEVDVSGMEIELIVRQVTVDATVRTPAGETEQRTMVLTLQRAIGVKDGATLEGRWIITGLEQS